MVKKQVCHLVTNQVMEPGLTLKFSCFLIENCCCKCNNIYVQVENKYEFLVCLKQGYRNTEKLY